LFTEGERKERYLAAGEFQEVFHVMQLNNEIYDLHQELLSSEQPEDDDKVVVSGWKELLLESKDHYLQRSQPKR
jgi:hypothetical protein